MTTLGELFPRLLTLPGYREMAARPHSLPRVATSRRPGPAGVAAPGPLVIRGHRPTSGYGRMAHRLADELGTLLGSPVEFSVIDGEAHDGPDATTPPPPRPCVQMSSPWMVHRSGDVLFSMWESGLLPAKSVEVYNAARAVVVPGPWNAELFRRSGVTTPIRVAPLGIDPGVYRPVDRSDRAGFTAISVNALDGGGHRKGVPELIRAFLDALGDKANARLVLKIGPDNTLADPGHPRIAIDRSRHDDAGLAALYGSADLYASMTRSEGWGLPPHEAAACGLPYCGPIHSELGVFLDPASSYPVAWDAEPASGPFYAETGDWYRPRHDSMVEQLRRAYADPEGRRAKGEAAAVRARAFTWEQSARELLSALREFGLAETPAVARSTPDRIRLAMLADLCPHASGPCGCGSGPPRTCSRPGRPREVRRAFCLECVREDEVTRSSTPDARPA